MGTHTFFSNSERDFYSENNNVQHDNMKNVSRGHIARSNEILGWGGVGHRQLLCFFKA
jgi:hypothetical protein